MQEIRTEHLTVGYDKTPLIGDVNLSVRPGEILTPVSYTHLTLPTKLEV